MRRLVLQSLNRLKYGRYYSAPLQPFSLLWISPSEIQQYPASKPKTRMLFPSSVVDGDWDLNLNWFANGIVFRSFRERFILKKCWSETPYYQFVLDQIEKNGQYKGYTDYRDVDSRCKELDRLFFQISTGGYLSQQELDNNKQETLHRHLHLPSEMREVTVDVSRRGKMLWRGGAHRLAIAKLLDIDEIPVRIDVRHESWQELRDRVYNGGSVETNLADHPDLQF